MSETAKISKDEIAAILALALQVEGLLGTADFQTGAMSPGDEDRMAITASIRAIPRLVAEVERLQSALDGALRIIKISQRLLAKEMTKGDTRDGFSPGFDPEEHGG